MSVDKMASDSLSVDFVGFAIRVHIKRWLFIPSIRHELLVSSLSLGLFVIIETLLS